MRRSYLEKGSDELKIKSDHALDDIVVDYIASMTDDYFLDVYEYLFGEKLPDDVYVSYFAQDVRSNE